MQWGEKEDDGSPQCRHCCWDWTCCWPGAASHLCAVSNGGGGWWKTSPFALWLFTLFLEFHFFIALWYTQLHKLRGRERENKTLFLVINFQNFGELICVVPSPAEPLKTVPPDYAMQLMHHSILPRLSFAFFSRNPTTTDFFFLKHTPKS